MRVGVSSEGMPPKLGDSLIFSVLPENYYRNTGKLLVDVDKFWVFDHNPYVERNVKADTVVRMWPVFAKTNRERTFAHTACKILNLPKCYLIHPRLYIFEDIAKIKSTIVHTTGKAHGFMPQHVINHIRKAYSGLVFQVGAETDIDAGVMDRRGLPLWTSIRYIAEAETLICVDSALMHVGMAYPKTRTKVVLNTWTEEQLETWHPLYGQEDMVTGWIPSFGVEYFNVFPYDIGVTRSYLKI